MITTPKTPKANRTITIPKFLCAALQEYINKIYQPDADTRIFPYSHSSYTDAFRSHSKKAGVKPIRLHGLRSTFTRTCSRQSKARLRKNLTFCRRNNAIYYQNLTTEQRKTPETPINKAFPGFSIEILRISVFLYNFITFKI